MWNPDESILSNVHFCPFQLPNGAEMDSPAEKTWDGKKHPSIGLFFFFFFFYCFCIQDKFWVGVKGVHTSR